MPKLYPKAFTPLEIYGKSLPGTTVSFITLTLLPQGIVQDILFNEQGLIVSNTIIIVITNALIGFIIGQGFLTFSELIEDYLYKLTRSWERSEIWFKRHRDQFEDALQNDTDYNDELIDLFKRMAKKYYELDQDPKSSDYLYTMTMSSLEAEEVNRANRLQASYYFTRSMWVILLILTILLTLLIVIQADVWLLSVFPYDNLYLVLFSGFLFFLYVKSAIIYKKYFIVYVLADFITYVRKQNQMSEINIDFI